MTSLFIRKVVSAFVVFFTVMTLAPQVVFAASLGAPTNVAIAGGQYTNDATPTFTWDRPFGATWYEYAFDSVANDHALGNVGSFTPTVALANGWHTFYVWAHDAAGNQSAYSSVVFEIDTVGPTVPAVSPSTATENEAVTFSVYPYGESTVTSCVLYVDGASAGAMSKNGSTFTKSYTFSWDGTYTVLARCTDGDGNVTVGSSRTVTVANEIPFEGTLTVPAVSPSTATEDKAVTFSVTPYGTLSATSCKLYVAGVSVGTMSKSYETFSKSYTFTNEGTYTVYAYCESEYGDWVWGTSRNVAVEGVYDEAPVVPAVSPSTATEDKEGEISVNPSSDERVSWCDLYVDGSNVGDMTRESDGEFTIDYTFTNSGSYTVYASCTDASYDTTRGTSRTITVSEVDENDTFIVPAVSPSSAIEDEEVTFEVTPYGDLDAESCKLYVSGSSVGTMSEYRGEFSLDYTFANDGSYTVYAYCEDENGDWTKGTSRTVDVHTLYDNVHTFIIPAVSPSSATEDEAVTFKVTPYGDLDAESCKLYVDGSNVGSMSESYGTFSKSYTFSNDGDYAVYAYCEDENGDWKKGTSRTVEVENENNDGTLSVPKVTPSSADEDEETEFTVRPTSNKNVTDCWLYVDGVRVETMDEESTNVFVAEYTFKNEGSYEVHASCKDSSGDTDTGEERTVTVGDGNDDVERGSLIKTDCGTSTSVSDPCRAVYYYDERGERHAFPNETTFYSWYKNFDDVIIVSKSFMSSLSLGENVTYRPGSVVVKFDSSSKVYAVEAERTLRHYETLSLLESDYGSDWSKSLVSLPDTLYKNYDLGKDIDSKTDFDRTEAYYSVDNIEDIF